jgi:hypothetical protein
MTMVKTYDLLDTGRGGYEPHYQLVESVDFESQPDGRGDWVRRDEAQARIRELEAALTLLTNGFKYSTEVVTIARNALGIEITRTSAETGVAK